MVQMERWQWWRRSLNFIGQQSPPQLVEGWMLLLATLFCFIWVEFHGWPYLVLSLSYILGAIASILVREWLRPSAYTHWIRLAAIASLALLALSSFAFLQEAVWCKRVLIAG